jgi:hypothetical protein
MRRIILASLLATGLLILAANRLADAAHILERIYRDADVTNPGVHKFFL